MTCGSHPLLDVVKTDEVMCENMGCLVISALTTFHKIYGEQVPLVISSPWTTQGFVTSPTHHIDMFPTIAEMVHLDLGSCALCSVWC